MADDEREALADRGLKRCGKRAGCGRVLPVAEFNRQRDTWDGLKSRCRDCTRRLDRDYFTEAPQGLRDRWNAATRAWQRANPGRANAKVRRWCQANPGRAHAIAKRYRDSETGKLTKKVAWQRRFDAEVAELVVKLDDLTDGWAAEGWSDEAEVNAAKRVKTAAELEAHRAERRAYRRIYGPIQQRLYGGYYRAVAGGVPALPIRPETLLAYWEADGIAADRCYYTGEPLGESWHLDHKYPLARYGTPGHVVGNLVPCTPAANQAKGSRTAEEYLSGLVAA